MNRFITLFLLFCCCLPHGVHAGGDTLEVRNAYNLAISLNRAFDERDSLLRTDSFNRSQLLNALYYYAARIDTTESATQISARLTQDPILGKMALQLIDSAKAKAIIALLLSISDTTQSRLLLTSGISWNGRAITPLSGASASLNNIVKSYISRSDTLKEIKKQAADILSKLTGNATDDSIKSKLLYFDTVSFSSRNFPSAERINDWLSRLKDINRLLSARGPAPADVHGTGSDPSVLSSKMGTIARWEIDLTQNPALFQILKDSTQLLRGAGNERDQVIRIKRQIQIAEKNANIVINTLPAQYTRPLSMSMPSETEMIDALAIYLVKRVKQETVLWFFETLKKKMNADTLVRQLLPNTIQLLSSGEVYEVPSFGTTWQYALSKDLIKLPETLFQSSWLKGKVKGIDTLYGPYLSAGVKIADLINQRMSINDVITQMHLHYLSYANDTLRRQARYIASAAHLLYGISQECYVIRKDTFNSMINYQNIAGMDDRSFRIMLELINLRYGNVFSNLGVNISNIRDIIPYKQWLANLLIDFNQLQKIKVSVDQKEEDKARFSNYNIWTMLQTFLAHLPPPVFGTQRDSVNLARFYKGVYLLGRSQNIYSAVQQKNYYGMVEECIGIIDTLMGDKLPDTKTLLGAFIAPKNYRRLFPDIPQHQVYKIVFQTPSFPSRKQALTIYAYDTLPGEDSIRITRFDLKAFRDKDSLSPAVVWKAPRSSLNLSEDSLRGSVRDSVLLYYFTANDKLVVNPYTILTGYSKSQYYANAIRYLKEISSFLADVAATKGSAELSTVIEKYALPPASYKRKRNVWHSLDINAFVGPYLGWEKVQKTDISNNKPYNGLKGVWGLSAPVGVTYTKTFGGRMNLQEPSEGISMYRIKKARYRFRKMSQWTFSITASIIDIGAVVSYRFRSSDSTLPQQVKWSQFVSPGLHLNMALPSTPLCFMAGGQFNPELRRFVNEDRQYGAFRFYCGIYFDLPLYNLHYKQ